MSKYVLLNGELYHYGIKGMKWGVRRFQNKDGSRTAAGKTRRKGHFNDDGTITDAGKKFYESEADRHAKRGNELEEKFLRAYEKGDMTLNRKRAEGLYKKASEYEKAANKEYAESDKLRQMIYDKTMYDKHGVPTKAYHEETKKYRLGLSKEASDSALERLHKGWIADPDKVDNPYAERDINDAIKLHQEVSRYSADGYERIGHTPSAEATMKKIRTIEDQAYEQYGLRKPPEVTKKLDKLFSEMDSIVLRDLGYADTEIGRKYIRDFWNSD